MGENITYTTLAAEDLEILEMLYRIFGLDE